MKSRQINIFLCLLLSVAMTAFITGCGNKKKSTRSSTSSTKLSESTKNIPLANLIPSTKVVTGKYKKELSEKVIDTYMYGTLAGQYGKLDVAEENLIKTLKQEPLFIEAHHNLGLCYYKEGRINDAVKEWKRTLELAPNYAETYYNLAIFLLDVNREDDAIEMMKLCVRYEPFHLKARYALGTICKRKGMNKDAIIHFKAYESKDHGDVRVLIALGELYLLEGQQDASLKAFESASRIDQKNGKIF